MPDPAGTDLFIKLFLVSLVAFQLVGDQLVDDQLVDDQLVGYHRVAYQPNRCSSLNRVRLKRISQALQATTDVRTATLPLNIQIYSGRRRCSRQGQSDVLSSWLKAYITSFTERTMVVAYFRTKVMNLQNQQGNKNTGADNNQPRTWITKSKKVTTVLVLANGIKVWWI
jgi:5-carboxymethyl-2-hydroxymuconate isomerase